MPTTLGLESSSTWATPAGALPGYAPVLAGQVAFFSFAAPEGSLDGVSLPLKVFVAGAKAGSVWQASPGIVRVGGVKWDNGHAVPLEVFALDSHAEPRAQVSIDVAYGGWLLYLTAPEQGRYEASVVRGVITQIGSLDDEDPFGWTNTTLTFPSLSIFDRPGSGELSWLSKEANVDLVWTGPLPAGYPYASMVYEGYIEGFDYSDDGLVATVKGAMYQGDNYQAKPEYLAQPLPYEVAIARQFAGRPDSRLAPFTVAWPIWWTKRYAPVAKANGAFIPTGVSPGDRWTALLTRETGRWEDMLSSYVRTLLGGMYTERGRFSLDLLPGRRPVLVHRDALVAANASTIVLDPANHGVKLTLSEDWSQTGNVYYGQNKSLQGQSSSGMVVSKDGQQTSYQPLAALRQVDPPTDRNGWLQNSRMRREKVLQLQQGLDRAQSETVGGFQLRLSAEPGLVGTAVLSADVRMSGGGVLSRFCVRSGMSLQIPGALGNEAGIFLHIAKVSRDLMGGSVTLTLDSKYRDALTVAEVMTRGRDALNVPRMLIGGLFTPPVPDQLVPWSYAEGSGYIPSGAGHNALPLFRDMPDNVVFPWESWTSSHPPGEAAWNSCYIPIGPKSANADSNWAVATSRGDGKYGFPVRMAQAGTIRLIQVAAYDADGFVLKVPFHISLYSSNGVAVHAMPMIPSGVVDGYAASQHYPFFDGAWENYKADGTQAPNEITAAVQSAGLVRGWGTGKIKAGYWPGSSGSGAPTGLLVDEDSWGIQVPVGGGTGDWGINPYSTKQAATYAGYMYVMIYCDAQAFDQVFFLGRCYRVEPGQGE